MKRVMVTVRSGLTGLLLILFTLTVIQAQTPEAIIALRALEFTPPRLEVPVGTAVTWRNESGQTHTIVSAEGHWRPVRLPPGVTYTRFFEQSGDFLYYSEAHGTSEGNGMAGRITVSPEEDIPVTGPDQAFTPQLVVSDQESGGKNVSVQRVTAAASSFVVIHPPGPQGQVDLENSLGHRTVPAGTTRDIVIPLDGGIRNSQTLFATLHIDQAGDGTFQYPGPDVPVEVAGQIVIEPFAVQVGPQTLPPAGRQSRPYQIALLGLLLVTAGYLLQRYLPADRPGNSPMNP